MLVWFWPEAGSPADQRTREVGQPRKGGWTPVKPLQQDGVCPAWSGKAFRLNDSQGTVGKQRRLLFARRPALKDMENKGAQLI